MILVMDTASENVFIGLWDDAQSKWAQKDGFLGGRELNSMIIKKLDYLFSNSQEFENRLTGIIVAAGPGSFTGLRIGISVANTLAYALNIPIVAPSETNDSENLLQQGLKLLEGVQPEFSQVVIPFYGADPHITKPKG